MKLAIVAGLGLAVSACLGSAPSVPTPPRSDARAQRLNRHVPELLREYKAAGAGVAIVDRGEVVWTGYYGEQGPGIPASAKTVFNTASVAKTVTAETLLALAAKGLISLDEPIDKYVRDPDLSSDPRFKKLTVRLLLSHRAGLKNWPYEYKDGHAAFIADPGTTFSYSGMGVDLAARFAEAKLGKDFEELAFEHVLSPAGVSEMSLGRIKPWMAGRLATPMRADGKYFPIAGSDGRLAHNAQNQWSAADDLLTTVDAYARFLVGVVRGDRLDATRLAERTQIIYSPQTRNGAVIFVNGGNGVFVSTQILELIGDQPEIAAYYRQLVKKFYQVTLPRLET